MTQSGHPPTGPLIIVLALILLVVGIIVSAVERGTLRVDKWRLPGDVSIHRGPVHIWVPVGTSILLSALLTVLLNLMFRT